LFVRLVWLPDIKKHFLCVFFYKKLLISMRFLFFLKTKNDYPNHTFLHKKNNFFMKKIAFFSILLLALLGTLVSCAQSGPASLKGTLTGAANIQATLEMAHLDRTRTSLGKAACDADGAFIIAPADGWKEGLYVLTMGAKRVYLMMDGTESVVTLKGDLAGLDKMQFEIDGSTACNTYVGVMRDMIGSTERTTEVKRAFVAKGSTALMRAFLAIQIFGSQPVEFMADLKRAGEELNADMPGTKYATDYTAMLDGVQKQINQQTAAQSIQVGQPAPDISLPGPDGKTHTLSDLKGKVVLLDFWASWCGPCRKANPHVVDTYKKYKSKGFEVFSVSLDGLDPRTKVTNEEAEQRRQNGKTAWVAAIRQDGLIWDNHVSDLKHWGSEPAGVYGVTSIPRTFLIGRDGKIVAINPRDNLEAELLKVL
jgi:thiol-disulfide isomerase/thioredoxin